MLFGEIFHLKNFVFFGLCCHNSDFMKLFGFSDLRPSVFFILLVSFCCLPVWAFEYYINQDGSAHLYSSFLMLELFKGNQPFNEIIAFNSFSIPNSSGHWLMAVLLNFLSPFLVTKIIVSLTFAVFVGSVGWLRIQTVGREGVKTSLLLGAALGFNWLWLVGFYNFLLGVGCFVFSVGLFFRWREEMNVRRAAIFAMLFLLAYFSHIVSFAVLAGSILLLVFSAQNANPKRNLLFILCALLPVLPLVIIYKSISAGGGGFFPVWRNLENPFSIVSWLTQIRTADLFIIISRKSFPFAAANSKFFALFTPLLWILAALFSLTAATLLGKNKTDNFSPTTKIFAVLFCSLVILAIFAPDDFGLNNGSVLRERLLLCGFVLFIPLFHAEKHLYLKRFAQFCLLFVTVFQTLALWDYARQTDLEAREFLSAKSVITANDKSAAVILVGDGLRFNSTPTSMMNNILATEINQVIWDNYEIGHYLFPIVAKNVADKQFVFELTQRTTFRLNDPGIDFEAKLSGLESVLTENHQKIDKLLLWGNNSRVEVVLAKWFAPEPIFENGRVRVFRHR